MNNRLCKFCNDIKNVDGFYSNSRCKKCRKEYVVLYNKKNKDKKHLYDKKYRKKNTIKITELKKIYYIKNKECISEKNIRNYNKNKEKVKEKVKKYRENNKEKIRLKRIKYYEKNKFEICEKKREERRNNIEKYLLKYAKERTRYNQCSISLIDIKNVMPENNICPLLEIKMMVNSGLVKDNSFTLDKINSYGEYEKNNILVISKKANTSKNNSTLEEYEEIVNNLDNILSGKTKIEVGGILDNYFIKRKLSSVKKRAIDNNLLFDINKNYIKNIYPKDETCPLLKIKMVLNKKHAEYNSLSLDRIIPSLGYVKENVMWISYKANRIKNNLTLDEMKLLLKNWKRVLKEKSI